MGYLIAAVLFILSVLIFLYFKGFFRSHQIYKIFNFIDPDQSDFITAIASLSDSFISSGKVVKFCKQADEIFEARMKAIQSAQVSIQFETYIMTPGKRANDFADVLIKKASQGVKIQLLVDTYGAKEISKSYWKNLKSSGIEVQLFNPLSWRDPFYYLRRNHRKLLLIDQKIALIGGAGISDDWDGTEQDLAPWLDYEVCFQGECLERLQGLFLQHWLDAKGTINLSEQPLAFHSSPQSEPSQILITAGENPTARDSSIRSTYQLFIQAARQRIWIASPYFLPDKNTQILLQEARKRGIDVRILTMGERCDKPFVHYTSRERYGQLLKSGIEIYEHKPSMMHAKLVLVDQHWVSLGSANFDPRSFFQNDELNLSIASFDLIKQIESFFLEAFQNSNFVNLRDWKRRSILQRLIARFWLLFYWQL
ncbi:MAG: phospholipase D-like domain-containing protein [Cyanobacteriota bacterium]|nr:phospholipase D-like domain-containing protein [Cyanobacteriota bacterium]